MNGPQARPDPGTAQQRVAFTRTAPLDQELAVAEVLSYGDLVYATASESIMKHVAIATLLVSGLCLAGTASGTSPPSLSLAVSVDGQSWTGACFVRGEPHQPPNCHRFRPWPIRREKTLTIRSADAVDKLAARWYSPRESRRPLRVRPVKRPPTRFWVLSLPSTSGKLVVDKSTRRGLSTWQVTVQRQRQGRN